MIHESDVLSASKEEEDLFTDPFNFSWLQTN